MKTLGFMITAIDFHCLSISVHLFTFRLDVAQLPPIMAYVIMFIIKDGVCHVVILSDIVLVVSTGVSFFMALKFDETPDPLPFQIQQGLLIALTASNVSPDAFRCFPKTGISIL